MSREGMKVKVAGPSCYTAMSAGLGQQTRRNLRDGHLERVQHP